MELGGNMPGDWETKLSLVFGKKDLAIEDHPDQPQVAYSSDSGNDDMVTLPFPHAKQQTPRLPVGPSGGRRLASPRRKPRSLSKN
jgi:hypothetical protein